jgi:DNA-binding transcriptional ArsR family regulator
MANHSATLDRTFHALSDPTRRQVIDTLTVRRVASISELAEPFPIGLPTFLKHVRVLEDCGLVSSEKVGRTRRCRLRTEPLDQAQEWLAQRREAVEEQLDAFTEYVESLARDQEGRR